MSRFPGSSNVPYRDGPPPARWDADRFAREQDFRRVDEYYQPAPPPPRRAPRPVYEDERIYYEDDRYGPRGSRVERQYFEEEDYYDPRTAGAQMVPYRQPRPPRPQAPPRPGLLRRQSSLDTFDRPPPARRYDDYDGYRPPQRPQRINIDMPEPPSPRSNRYRPSRPARPAYDYYDERDYYDDVAVQDPDLYGDEGFREYREREWVSRKRRDSSGSRSHSRSRAPTEVVEEKKEEVKKETKEVVRKEEIKEEIKEKPYPRRGKTKMPKRLVHTKVLFDLGYPFYEESEKTIIIEKALGPDNIDEVFAKSREYREKEVSTTRLIEAPPPSAPPPRSTITTVVAEPPPPPSSVRSPPPRAPTVREPSIVAPSVRESFDEEVFKETKIKTVPISEAPRSVREWDQLTVRDDARSVQSAPRRRKSSHRARSERRSDDEEIFIERKSTIVEREPSPSPERRRRRTRSKSRRRGSFDETEIIERRVVREEDDFEYGDSNSVHVGPLALVVDRNRGSRDERDIKEKIRQLEAEQRSLRRERRTERDSGEIYVERRAPSPTPSAHGEVIIERRGDDEILEVRKDRRDRSFSRTRAPSAGLIKSMFYTLT